jgi:hypothetical protein
LAFCRLSVAPAEVVFVSKWLALGILALTFVGCSKNTSSWYFQLNSDTSWSAAVEPVGNPNKTVLYEGSGSRRIDVSDPPSVCIDVHKTVVNGSVEVIAYKHVTKKGGWFHGDENEDIEQGRDSTDDPMGQCGVCTQK